MSYLIWAIGAPVVVGAICFLFGYALGIKTEIKRLERIQDKE